MTERLARLLVRSVDLARIPFVVLGFGIACLALGGRRDDDPAVLVALVMAVGLVIVGIQRLGQSRRRQRSIAEGVFIRLRLIGRRDVRAFAAIVDADVTGESLWDPNVREGYIRAVGRWALAATWAIVARPTGAILGSTAAAAGGELEADLYVSSGQLCRRSGSRRQLRHVLGKAA